MTGFSDLASKAILNHYTGQQSVGALPSLWLALFTAVGTDAGTGFTEVTGGSYARQQIAGSVTTNGTTAAANATLHFASVPSWIVAGMSVHDATSSSVIPAGTTVLSTTSTTVVMSANATGGGVGSGDTINFSAFTESTGSAPSQATNGGTIAFVQSTASWGTVIAFGVYDASTSGNLLWWDYLFNGNWMPCTVSSASPGVITAKAHGFSVGDNVIFSTEYGGTAPSFSQSNFTGILAVAHAATDTFDVTNSSTQVNTSSTGSGSVRKILQQSIPINTTFSISSSNITFSLA